MTVRHLLNVQTRKVHIYVRVEKDTREMDTPAKISTSVKVKIHVLQMQIVPIAAGRLTVAVKLVFKDMATHNVQMSTNVNYVLITVLMTLFVQTLMVHILAFVTMDTPATE